MKHEKLEVFIIKKLKIDISMPYSGLSEGKSFETHVHKDANLAEALAQVDQNVKNNPEDSIFPIFEGYIHNYLQLIWNPKKMSFTTISG